MIKQWIENFSFIQKFVIVSYMYPERLQNLKCNLWFLNNYVKGTRKF
jgi:hypothetical protein